MGMKDSRERPAQLLGFHEILLDNPVKAKEINVCTGSEHCTYSWRARERRLLNKRMATEE